VEGGKQKEADGSGGNRKEEGEKIEEETNASKMSFGWFCPTCNQQVAAQKSEVYINKASPVCSFDIPPSGRPGSGVPRSEFRFRCRIRHIYTFPCPTRYLIPSFPQFPNFRISSFLCPSFLFLAFPFFFLK
jgi:hypothetical protein